MEWPFSEQHPAGQTPSWIPTRPPTLTLDMLLEIRQKIGATPGRLSMFIGHMLVSRMAGLIDGHRLCLTLAGFRDEEYFRFERWLQEEKGLPPGQDWSQPLLSACQGDAEQAIFRLLDFAVEFRGG